MHACVSRRGHHINPPPKKKKKKKKKISTARPTPQQSVSLNMLTVHDDVIKWKHFPRYWPFVRGIHRSPGNSPHKGQWRRALMVSLVSARINGWVKNREAGDLRRIRRHYDVTVMFHHPAVLSIFRGWPHTILYITGTSYERHGEFTIRSIQPFVLMYIYIYIYIVIKFRVTAPLCGESNGDDLFNVNNKWRH